MKAVIYARVSSTNDRQSTDRQVADLTSYATYSNMEVIKVFKEKISGGKKNSERPILVEALEYCRVEKVDMLLVNELSRLGRNALEVLSTVKDLANDGINLYLQKEKFTLLDDNKELATFATIMLATLSTCAQLERENIKFRLNSGRKLYIEKGGQLGRKMGSIKSADKKKEEYKDVLKALRQGLSVRQVAKLTDTSTSTVQRLKKEFQL